MSLRSVGNPRYIALQTFRKNGKGVITPVWVTEQGGKLYVWTDRTSGKVKRVRRNPAVKLCASDMRGKPRGVWVDAQARVLDGAEDVTQGIKRLAAKYGWQYKLLSLLGSRRGQNRDSIIIELTAVSA